MHVEYAYLYQYAHVEYTYISNVHTVQQHGLAFLRDPTYENKSENLIRNTKGVRGVFEFKGKSGENEMMEKVI